MDTLFTVDKTCRDCGHVGPNDDFPRSSHSRDGRMNICVGCNRRRARDWGRANPERVAERSRAWVEANRERSRERARAYYRENSERVNERNRRWIEANREKRRAVVRASDEKHREKRRAYSREYARRVDPEKSREQQRVWKRANREKVAYGNHMRRARGTDDPESYMAYVDILHADPCAYCGEEAGHIDHIVPIARGGTNDWDNLTAACGRCNSSKWAKPLLAFMARG
jgi:5-methylcytosine-specific restriction endonuclease McrA